MTDNSVSAILLITIDFVKHLKIKTTLLKHGVSATTCHHHQMQMKHVKSPIVQEFKFYILFFILHNPFFELPQISFYIGVNLNLALLCNSFFFGWSIVHSLKPFYQSAFDSETRTTTRTRLSPAKLSSARAREPASFWREDVIVVIILLHVLARMSYWWEQVIEVQQFNHIATRKGLNLLQ